MSGGGDLTVAFDGWLRERACGMRVVPVVDEGLGNSAYVVDLGDGGALVVDPERDPRPYLAELERRRLALRWVAETHLHADFVSGGLELVAAGARLLAPAASRLAYGHRPLADGDEPDLGGLTLRALATPGHTPEHLAYLLLDGDRPVAVFSGGTLTAGGTARTDLLAPESTEPLARAAYRSIRERLFALPDDLAVYPTHGAGSFCSAGRPGERTTTIGREKASNPLLAGDPDEDTFVARLLDGYGSFPHYFLELRAVNRAGPRVHGPTPPPLPRLSVEQLDTARADGAEVVDARPIEAYAAGHVPASLSNPWRPQFATWLGWLLPLDRALVFVVDRTVDLSDLAWACRTVGFERLVGVLGEGIDAWAAAGRKVATTALVDADPGGRRVVDVRQADEFASGHAAGATNVELGSLADDPSRAGGGPLLVHCSHGQRAMSAASLLERAGETDVAVLAGGPRDLARSDAATAGP